MALQGALQAPQGGGVARACGRRAVSLGFPWLAVRARDREAGREHDGVRQLSRATFDLPDWPGRASDA